MYSPRTPVGSACIERSERRRDPPECGSRDASLRRRLILRGEVLHQQPVDEDIAAANPPQKQAFDAVVEPGDEVAELMHIARTGLAAQLAGTRQP